MRLDMPPNTICHSLWCTQNVRRNCLHCSGANTYCRRLVLVEGVPPHATPPGR